MAGDSWILPAACLGLAVLVGAVLLWARGGRRGQDPKSTSRPPTFPPGPTAPKRAPRPPAPPPPTPPRPGPALSSSMIPRADDNFAPGYKIKRLIATGGMGSVYEAEDLTLHRKVAIKRLRSELRGEEGEKDRFLKEARIVAGLRHPNIIEIHTVVDGGEDLYLVFEYVDGRTLDDVIRAKGGLEIQVCRKILRQIASALAFAHERKVLHRDLKPANVMLSHAGVIKVMDFGIARQAQETLSRLSPAQAYGTLSYMSPEQHLGEEKRPADIYAVGITLYEMLSGMLPFAGPDSLLLKERLEYRPISQLVPALGTAADAFFNRAIAPKPAERFQTVTELLAAFEEAFPRQGEKQE